MVLLVCALGREASARTIEIGVGSTLPLDFGARLRLDLPWGFFLQGNVGYLPTPYLNLANDLIVAAGGYSDEAAELVENTLQDAVVIQSFIGWSPFFGLEIFGGYTFISLGGQASSRGAIERLSGRQLPGQFDLMIPVSSSIHAVQFGIGWGPTFGPLRIRFSAALVNAVASNSKIDLRPTTTIGQTVIDEGSRILDTYLDTLYEEEFFLPVIGLDLLLGF